MATLSPAPTFKPLYQQIKMLITQSLISGEWGPGEAIPSEIELAQRYQVSQGTVRKAISELAHENLLVRHQGKGTFVASHSEERRKYHFFRIYPDTGGRIYSEGDLLSCERGKADPETAKLLEVSKGATLIVVTRLMRMESVPVMYEEIRLPAALFKGLNAARINEFHCRMYSMFESAYGIQILQVAEQIKAVNATPEPARLLGVPEGAPLLSIDRVSYTYGDKPVEVRKTLCNTHDYAYVNKIV
jgi:GntR family transcriptional regulator